MEGFDFGLQRAERDAVVSGYRYGIAVKTARGHHTAPERSYVLLSSDIAQTHCGNEKKTSITSYDRRMIRIKEGAKRRLFS